MCPERRAFVALYSPGGGVAIAATEAWLYVDAPPNDPLVTRTWTHLHGDGALRQRVEAVAEELSNAEVAFGLVAQLDGALVVVLGGVVGAEIEATGTSEPLRCPAALRRVDHRLRQLPSSIRLSSQGEVEDGSTLLPLGAGVASASQVLLSPTAVVVRRPEPTDAGDGAVGAPDIEPPSGRPGLLAPDEALPRSDLAPKGAADAAEPLPVFANGSDPVAPGLEGTGGGAGPDVRSDGEDAQVAAAADHDDDGGSGSGSGDTGAGGEGYGFLFGHTVNRSVADAAVQPPGEEEPPQPPMGVVDDDLRGADTLWEVPAVPEQAPEPDRQAEPRPTLAREPEPGPLPPPAPDPTFPAVQGGPAKPGGIIDSVPWSVAAEPPPGGPAAAADPPPASAGAPVAPSAAGAPSSAGDRDALELTMSRQAANALAQRVAPEPGPPARGPTVHAVHCSSGHLNPPQADLCRVCGVPVAAQPPVTVPRPVLGYLRFSTGDVIPLDRNVLIGRQPATDRLVDGLRPHVVKVPSPERDVSRNHLEIHLDDWHVLATDLDSTNGTILVRPGSPPERLRPAQATMIEPGTKVSLADDVSFSFEAK